jgi:hypothetical protein
LRILHSINPSAFTLVAELALVKVKSPLPSVGFKL